VLRPLLILNIFYSSMGFFGSFIFEMATTFAKVKIIFPDDSYQNGSVSDKKHSSSFCFSCGHSASWWFNCNFRDPITGFICFLL